MHYNLSGMLRVAFVLLLIRFTLATFQLRIQFSFGLRPIFPRPFIKSGLTSNALCLFWRLLQWPKPPLPPHFPPRFHSSSCCPFFFGCSLCFCRVIFNSFTFCTSALCVTNCFCVAVFTIVWKYFLLNKNTFISELFLSFSWNFSGLSPEPLCNLQPCTRPSSSHNEPATNANTEMHRISRSRVGRV